MRYLADRGIAPTRERHVWGVFGDGEMDEPASVGALTLATRSSQKKRVESKVKRGVVKVMRGRVDEQ